MAFKVIARLPEDLGQEINYGATTPMQITDGNICEWCNETPATIVVKCETDSFGFELGWICPACLEQCNLSHNDRLASLDIPETEAPVGMVFAFDATTNIDACKDWYFANTNLRKVTSFMREREDEAAALGGFYPNNGVITITLEDSELRQLAHDKNVGV